MSKPSRHVPRVGDHAEVVHLGDRHIFDLNRVRAHFVRRGEPYWGARLRITPSVAGRVGLI